MNHKTIFIIACIFNSHIFGTLKPIITICDKSSLLAFISSIIKSEIPGTIVSRHIPYFKYMIYSNPNNSNQPRFSFSSPFIYDPERLRSKETEANISLFGGNFKSNIKLTPSEVSLHIANIGIIDAEEELKIANIIHCIRPGIIESNPGEGVTVRYYDESIKTDLPKK